jgi:hypothetical protein
LKHNVSKSPALRRAFPFDEHSSFCGESSLEGRSLAFQGSIADGSQFDTVHQAKPDEKALEKAAFCAKNRPKTVVFHRQSLPLR